MSDPLTALRGVALLVWLSAPVLAQDAVLIGAGDIASCEGPAAGATSLLLAAWPTATVFTLGDNAYERGTTREFRDCYDSTWGRFKTRTRPTPGNHEYLTPHAAGYFGYFHVPNNYSYDLGGWHMLALDSIHPNAAWVRDDLRRHPARCTLAYWHYPVFSSGRNGPIGAMQPIWQALYDAHADVVLSGHDHDYERFAPQGPHGGAQPTRGIRQFVVGTGGKGLHPFKRPRSNSEVRNATTFGVLKLTLHPTTYDWAFVAVAGALFTDRGTGVCVP